ncbi:MAG: ABC transporter permease [Pirellulales bacterium]|nr:ABC transporter permease [Pirellulales bacterium]
MRLWNVVVKNVLRRKTRSLLTASGVAVAIGSVVALLGVSRGYQQTSEDLYANRGVDLVVVRAGVALASAMDESYAELLKALPHVDRVGYSLGDNVSFGDDVLSIRIHGWPVGSYAFETLNLTEGRGITDADAAMDGSGGVLLGKSLAERLNKKLGDATEIEGTPFKVVGIFQSANIIENGAAVLPLAALQKIMQREGQVNEFQITIKKHSPEADRQAMQELRKQIEALKVDGERLGLVAQPSMEFVNSRAEVRMSRAMSFIISGIALLIGSVGMLNTMVMSVLERTQEIGLLRAIGWRKTRITRMILLEALVLSVVGCLAGTLAALGLTLALSSAPVVQGVIQRGITPGVVGAGFVMSLVVGLAGGLYPAYRGASLPPTEALRYE